MMSRQHVVFRVAHLSRVGGKEDDPPDTCALCAVDEVVDGGGFRVEEDAVDVRVSVRWLSRSALDPLPLVKHDGAVVSRVQVTGEHHRKADTKHSIRR